MEKFQVNFASNQHLQNSKIRDQPSKGLPQLITFDDICDQLDDELMEDSQEDEKSQKFEPAGQSSVRKTQIRKKFQQFVGSNKAIERRNFRNQNHDDFEDHQNIDPKGKLIKQFKQIRIEQKMNRQRQHFIIAFNKKPEQAINQFIKKGLIQDDPHSIAEHITKTQGLNKIVLGEYFGQNKERNLKVLRQLCGILDFKDVQFDLALRKLLAKFRLPGQAQQIERIVWQFAQAYFETNQDYYDSADQLHVFSYAIIMLATNAHNPKVEKKMTKEEFIDQTKYGCPHIGHDKFSEVYDRVTSRKLQTELSVTQTIYSRLKDISLHDIPGALNIANQLKKGHTFLKSCKNTNKFVQRKVYLSFDEKKILWVNEPAKNQEQPRQILVKDIKDINLGLESDVMKRNKVPEQFDSLCFTITTANRTLDLKAQTNKIRAKWINYLRAILVQKRDQRIASAQESHQINWSEQKIEDLWNTDIFPFWDKHWDYKNRKPKSKGYFIRGVQMMCSCWRNSNTDFQQKYLAYNLKIKETLLDTLWRYGLPKTSRKTLWPLVIGNNLALTPHMLDQLKKRKREVPEFKKWSSKKQIIEMGQLLMANRPDLPPVKQLLTLCQVFNQVIPKNNSNNPLFGLINLIHSHHFLNMYRRDKCETQIRFQLFSNLLKRNCRSVFNHFKVIKLEPRMYMLHWFLQVFSSSFQGQFLFRIWDSFLLQGQLYLYKVGITIIKYYEIELKMCTFQEGTKILRLPPKPSAVLFFQILENQINVKQFDFQEGVEKRKHAVVKAKVQQIPLE